MQKKVTHRDSNQISVHEHDQEQDAKRVIIVGGEMPKFEVSSSSQKIQTIEIPTIIKELQIKEIEKPIIVIQKELQIEKVEIPIIIERTEIVTIEKPIVITQFEYKEIEKPIIVYKTEYKDLTKLVYALLAVQALTSIILLLKK